MGLIITFLISLFVLVLLFGAKWLEEKRGNKNFISSGISKLDPVAHTIFSYIEFKIKQISQTIKYFVVVILPRRSEESFREARKATMGHYKKQKEILMGKKSLVNANSASFYLKKIKEGKINGEEGRIEDESLEDKI